MKINSNEYVESSIKYYQKRVDFGGWKEEVYLSLYNIGLLMMNRDDPFHEYSSQLLKAHLYHPSRLEALYTLIKKCRELRKIKEGYEFGKMALNSEGFHDYPTKDLLFIDRNLHLWKFYDELAVLAFMSGDKEMAVKLLEKVHSDKYFPQDQKLRLDKNLKFFKGKITAKDL